MASRIPPRVPVGDALSAAPVLRVRAAHVLAAHPHPDAETAHSGALMLRYGARFLGKPFLAIVPALIALEYGDFMNGEAAWEFVTKRSNLYPRADVIGYMHDGKDEMLPVKRLDLALPPMVLAYADDAQTVPLAEISALIGDLDGLPDRLREYVPRYDTLAAFIASQSDDANPAG
jgi:hypothetical protein